MNWQGVVGGEPRSVSQRPPRPWLRGVHCWFGVTNSFLAPGNLSAATDARNQGFPDSPSEKVLTSVWLIGIGLNEVTPSGLPPFNLHNVQTPKYAYMRTDNSAGLGDISVRVMEILRDTSSEARRRWRRAHPVPRVPAAARNHAGDPLPFPFRNSTTTAARAAKSNHKPKQPRARVLSQNYHYVSSELKSGGGQPHSKTLRVFRRIGGRASVLECGCPLPLWRAKVDAILRHFTGTACTDQERTV
jgi:hypothetical protein